MSRNNAGRSNVRGPNSALTEFLRSRGIRIENQAHRARGQPAQPTAPIQEEEGATEGDSVEQTEEVAAELAEAAAAAASASSRPVTPKKKPIKRKKKQLDEDDEDDADYEPLPRPSAGQIEFCAECNTRFTVTPYNKDAPDGRGLLCTPCGKALVGTPAKPKAAPVARKKRAKATLDGERLLVPKLQDLSIQTIAAHIDQVDALGDIGHFNLDKICQIICKNRKLSTATLPLFLDAGATSLSLYDCATLNKDSLKQVAQLCPHLVSLHLHLCGQLTDDILTFYTTHLAQLKSILLFGSFLITTACWQSFFKAKPALEEFQISSTSRFDHVTMQVLVDSCPEVRVLTLRRLTHLGAQAVQSLAQLSKLTQLDVSHAGEEVTDEAIDQVLAANPHMECLDLSGLTSLTDATLASIARHCTRLHTLRLNECDMLTDAGCVALFSTWHANPGLQVLELERCVKLGDASVAAILAHSGKSLKRLILNSLDTVTAEGCMKLAAAQALPVCEVLDVSWIRAVDDVIVRRLVKQAGALEKLLVWGNNLLTAVEHPGMAVVVGRESG